MVQEKTSRDAIAAAGNSASPHELNVARALFFSEQEALAASLQPSEVDLAYGPHERHRLDLYKPVEQAGIDRAPVMVWLHGGGFVRGAKSAPGEPYNAHVGRFAARAGFLGVVVNYRLAPQVVWPAGGEDVAAIVRWLREHVSAHGGDPDRIVIMGSSAGAMHLTTYLRLNPDARDIRAAVLLSGLYGYTPVEEREAAYYRGAEEAYFGTHPLAAVLRGDMPLLIACAEHDPPRFQSEFLSVLRDTLEARGRLPVAHVAMGHSHYSLACHIGGSDTRLTDEILSFVHGQIEGKTPEVDPDAAQPTLVLAPSTIG